MTKSKLMAPILLVLIAFASVAVYAQPRNDVVEVGLRDFFQAYFKQSMKYHYKVEHRIELPQAWLYAPTGQFSDKVTQSSGIDGLKQHFSSGSDAAKGSNQPTLRQMMQVIGISSGQSIDSGRTTSSNQWTLVFLDAPVPPCHHCSAFEQAVNQLAKQYPEKLRVVKVLVNPSK
jgi:hypothetical protein